MTAKLGAHIWLPSGGSILAEVSPARSDAECRVLSYSHFLFMFPNTSHQTSLLLSHRTPRSAGAAFNRAVSTSDQLRISLISELVWESDIFLVATVQAGSSRSTCAAQKSPTAASRQPA